MKVFLDIDGVMVHANPHRKVELEDDGFYRFAYKAISAINSIENAEIILSTSHRHRFTINIWEKMFVKRGVHFISISIIETENSYKISRREEIEKWVEFKHYSVNEIIIIDDDKSLNALPKHLKDRVVLTSPYRGLDDDNEIKKILEKGAYK
ncbi:HAD domain-containing protein [Chryseobacterium sp. WG14]|uniref:HAD domain-containing protein n=1 Tax=Chryseobacterium sp. WG14 TaxID=2926909 RepID=UPI00211E075B|nr:HAD domain-containing protein [Chryseobacterium sp. WG14]MCQ9640978.1 HAD domain-containing protein [Chryseobacterium sp. WG14]